MTRARSFEVGEVTVFERTAPGAGTTGTSYGWVNSHRKQPLSYHELNVAGMAEHRALWEPGCDWHVRSGLLEWASDVDGRDRLAARAPLSGPLDSRLFAHRPNRRLRPCPSSARGR